LRTADKLRRARETIAAMQVTLGERPFGRGGKFDLQRLEWFDLRNMLLVAKSVADAAHSRTESRGAHQREDFTEMLPAWQLNQHVRWKEGGIALAQSPTTMHAAAQ
jgi:succinate dehydrogenase / fumarate reductase, flavoprotein subunit